MPHLAWLTDIHLNFLDADQFDEFLATAARYEADAILIGGDFAEAPDVVRYLERFEEAFERPIYFVLGNHDFYRGSIAEVRRRVTEFCQERKFLHYLTADGTVEITPSVGLVGHDGWADARIGDYQRSMVMMNDYRLIEELAQGGKEWRWPVLKALGDEAAAHVHRVLPEALDRYEHVVLLTHVPPLREACWYDGKMSDDEWAPHFTCKALGDAILQIMGDRPESRLTVLCGHTHSAGECRPLENVHILTGGAEYGQPELQRIFEF